jgi:hypothetical protein
MRSLFRTGTFQSQSMCKCPQKKKILQELRILATDLHE